ncbi:unnamed protein product [Rotaria sp. Silwood2]|nr:unnamed protein product [Rotaria sp. Silwood2]
MKSNSQVDRSKHFFDAAEETLAPIIPISGYMNGPLLPLQEAVRKCFRGSGRYDQAVQEVLKLPENLIGNLTRNEAAAIRLYTLETDPRFYTKLNTMLRLEDRNQIKPYFSYLKLMMKGLSKLPPIRSTIWRVVSEDLHEKYTIGKKITWWAFSSCTSSVDIFNIPKNASWAPKPIIVAGGEEEGNSEKHLHGPAGLCIDCDGNILVADFYNHRIVEWKPHSTSGTVVAGGNGQGNGPKQLRNTSDVIFDAETDSLIICDLGNRRVVQWRRQNNSDEKTLIENISSSGLVMDYQRCLYVTDLDKHAVRRFELKNKDNQLVVANNEGTIVAGGNGMGNPLNQFNKPTCVWVDRDLNVYISDRNNHRVMKWKKHAEVGEVVAGDQTCGTHLSQLNGPRGVLVDSFGTLYVADYNNNRVMRWCNENSSVSVIAGGCDSSTRINHVNVPLALSFDKHGNFYVSDSKKYQILRFSIKGTVWSLID